MKYKRPFSLLKECSGLIPLLVQFKSEIQKTFQFAERMFRVDPSASTVLRTDAKTIMHGLLTTVNILAEFGGRGIN